MRNLWIVVADAGRALILSKIEGSPDLSLVQQLENPDGRAHNVDLVTAPRGRCVSHTGAQSAMEAPTEPHETKAREFAHELNHWLDAAASRGRFDFLEIVAPPHFLGLLRAGMRPESNRRLLTSVAKDLTRLTIPQLQSHLGELLDLPFTAVKRPQGHSQASAKDSS